jgi:hypothetical protein
MVLLPAEVDEKPEHIAAVIATVLAVLSEYDTLILPPETSKDSPIWYSVLVGAVEISILVIVVGITSSLPSLRN